VSRTDRGPSPVPDFPRDLPAIEDVIRERRVVLVIVDVLMAYLAATSTPTMTRMCAGRCTRSRRWLNGAAAACSSCGT
jgi:hypothetical protein